MGNQWRIRRAGGASRGGMGFSSSPGEAARARGASRGCPGGGSPFGEVPGIISFHREQGFSTANTLFEFLPAGRRGVLSLLFRMI
eukprot:11084392-Alexandrium_andersonii.AAC.1